MEGGGEGKGQGRLGGHGCRRGVWRKEGREEVKGQSGKMLRHCHQRWCHVKARGSRHSRGTSEWVSIASKGKEENVWGNRRSRLEDRGGGYRGGERGVKRSDKGVRDKAQ